MYVGRFEEALAWLKKAIRLDPIPKNWFLTCVGICYLHMGKYEQAVDEFKRVINRNPKDLTALVRLVVAYTLMGREEEAHATAAEVLKLNPKFSVERVGKGWPYKNDEDRRLGTNALRKAGLPD